MARRSKYDFAAMHVAMAVECTECHYKIPPAEIVRLDSEPYGCPKCRAKFVTPEKPGPRMRTSYDPLTGVHFSARRRIAAL